MAGQVDSMGRRLPTGPSNDTYQEQLQELIDTSNSKAGRHLPPRTNRGCWTSPKIVSDLPLGWRPA